MSMNDYSGQFAGRYYLMFILNSGATSSVYCAVDKYCPGVKYAIKCIPKVNLTPRQLFRRTLEVFHHQLVTGCSPYVLPLTEIINEDSHMFLVFKLCDGDLHKAIWDHRIYQRNDALIKETFVDIVDGVYACHSVGVFHRDLKPENIMCNHDGSGILIADFGLATRNRVCKRRCGTFDYMSPEQWSDTIYYPSRSDIWSLGIILVNLVTGRRPWNAARTSNAQFRAFIEDEDYLYNNFPISRSLNHLLKWIFCPNPFGRPQILQIRQAIRNIDTFYRNPEPSTIGWSKRMALIQAGYSPNDMPDEDKDQIGNAS